MLSMFEAVNPWDGASSAVRRALSLLDLESPAYLKLKEACERHEIPHKTPFWTSDAWAHFGFPRAKAVLFVIGNKDTARLLRLGKMWENSGNRVMFAGVAKIERLSVDAVARQLDHAFQYEKSKSKSKRK